MTIPSQNNAINEDAHEQERAHIADKVEEGLDTLADGATRTPAKSTHRKTGPVIRARTGDRAPIPIRMSSEDEARSYLLPIDYLEDNSILSPSEAKKARVRVRKIFSEAAYSWRFMTRADAAGQEKLRDAEKTVALIEKRIEDADRAAAMMRDRVRE